jgi:hypothetical protein
MTSNTLTAVRPRRSEPAPGQTTPHRDFARNLLNRWPASGRSPTPNRPTTTPNAGRGAVIYRRLSLGRQSERGERTIERLLSASITCRLRKQSLFAYLTQTLAVSCRCDS